MLSLTIITVTLNNRDSVGATICSVLSQSYGAVEYILIDGGSTDGTLEILDSYRDKVTTIISEPDNGIYDAMNKGLRLASGDVIGILNADDIYATNDMLARVASIFETSGVDACYGDLAYISAQDTDHFVRFWKAGDYTRRKLYYGWMPPHPTFFVRKSCYTDFGVYRTDMGSAADYELMLRYLLCHNINMVYIPDVLVKMRTGGTSNASLFNRLNAHLMDWRAWYINGLQPYPWTLPLKPLRKLHQWFAKD